MRYDQAAILTDLDGTLFDSQGIVTKESRAAIRAFIAGGGLFAVATGREPRNARRHLPDVPLNGPSVCLNGAAVYDFVHRRYISAIPMDKEAAQDVLLHCLEMDWPLDLQVYTDDGIYYASPLDTADPGLALVEGTTDVVKIGKYQELLPQDVNKGTGVDALRQLPVYAGRTLIAVGDYWNDMELLEAADIACCPANAIPEVKAVCAHILPSHNDDPMVALIRDVIPAL